MSHSLLIGIIHIFIMSIGLIYCLKLLLLSPAWKSAWWLFFVATFIFILRRAAMTIDDIMCPPYNPDIIIIFFKDLLPLCGSASMSSALIVLYHLFAKYLKSIELQEGKSNGKDP